jgi:hypothetical protein
MEDLDLILVRHSALTVSWFGRMVRKAATIGRS